MPHSRKPLWCMCSEKHFLRMQQSVQGCRKLQRTLKDTVIHLLVLWFHVFTFKDCENANTLTYSLPIMVYLEYLVNSRVITDQRSVINLFNTVIPDTYVALATFTGFLIYIIMNLIRKCYYEWNMWRITCVKLSEQVAKKWWWLWKWLVLQSQAQRVMSTQCILI